MSSTPLYRSEVVGSLLRPAYLKQAIEWFDAGSLTERELRAVEDRAVLEAIELQETCGIDVITDGEMRRRSWSGPLTRGLAGFTHEALAPVPFGSGGATTTVAARLPAVTAKLAFAENLPLQECQFLRANAHSPVKATLPSMTYASVLWVPGVSDQAYPDRHEYLRDALRLMREIVGQLAAAGITYIQLDAPRYTHLVSEEGRDNFRRLQLDPDTWLGDMIALDNALMADFPQVTFAVHLCRGNSRSMWSVEGGYDPIAEQLFNDLDVQRLFLEYDTPRAGTFAPLRFVSSGKTAILGLITTKEPGLESEDLLRRRVEEAAQYLPLDRLALSPQCGFASHVAGNIITDEAQRAKLMLLGRVAKKIWR